jgi:hypothetical protein
MKNHQFDIIPHFNASASLKYESCLTQKQIVRSKPCPNFAFMISFKCVEFNFIVLTREQEPLIVSNFMS